MVYSSALEMRRAERHREFESHLLRIAKNRSQPEADPPAGGESHLPTALM